LRRVFRVPSIAQHRQCKSHAGLDERPDQRLEGGFVAGDRA
jgi:hypothetical protein